MKKLIFALLFLAAFALNAQNTPPKNWFNLDPVKDSVNGVSTEKALEYLKGRKSKKVLVAVIDSGIDIEHEDLRDVVWTNEDEIPGNGIDDDNNGFVDDIHGWNFIGGKDGRNVGKDTYELTREYKRLKEKYEGKSAEDIAKSQKEEFEYWQKIKADFEKTYNESNQQVLIMNSVNSQLKRYNKLFEAYLLDDEITFEDLSKINSTDQVISRGKEVLSQIYGMTDSSLSVDTLIYLIDQDIERASEDTKFAYSLDFDPREIVGDDPTKLDEVGYGNNDVIGKGTDNFHGTHVSGIIAAVRGNGIGIDGVADNVEIMAIRAVPDGDERDKDVANAIRYAVDNGAQIVNMSFGKSYSPNSEYVFEAIEYAAKKGVLLIHAAGNSAENIDEANNYPNDKFGRRKDWPNWIEVGASSWGSENNYVGVFSNYGKKTVDVFAPGVAIYSLAPGNEYQDAQGTSMAAPVTTGVAALLLSYFPELRAEQVKDILMKSVRGIDVKVNQPGTGEEVKFSSLSVSGGIINAYEAVKLAESMKLKGKK